MRQPEDVGPRHGWLFAPAGEPPRMQVMCIGGACVDRAYNVHGAVIYASSNPAIRNPPHFGGVARNVAENLARLNVSTGLFCAAGNDAAGRALVAELESAGVDASLVQRIDGPTDEYAAFLERGELALGAADMRGAESLAAAQLDRGWEAIAAAQWIFVDCNVSPELLRACVDRRSIASYRLALDAVSAPKARRLPAVLARVDLLFINEGEARSYLVSEGLADDPESLAAQLLARGAGAVVLSCGARGAVCGDRSGTVRIAAMPGTPAAVTGAGDALIAGTLWRLTAGDDLRDAVRTGTELAALTIQSERSVRSDLSPQLLEEFALQRAR